MKKRMMQDNGIFGHLESMDIVSYNSNKNHDFFSNSRELLLTNFKIAFDYRLTISKNVFSTTDLKYLKLILIEQQSFHFIWRTIPKSNILRATAAQHSPQTVPLDEQEEDMSGFDCLLSALEIVVHSVFGTASSVQLSRWIWG